MSLVWTIGLVMILPATIMGLVGIWCITRISKKIEEEKKG